MNTKTKLVLSAIGLFAIAATPAMAKTHRAHHAYHSHVARIAPPVAAWTGSYAFEPGFVGAYQPRLGGAYAYEPGAPRTPTSYLPGWRGEYGNPYDRQLADRF